MSDNTRSPRGFTLVELLVVIGIIAVLVGVLLPVLAGVASRGRDIKCQANLRSTLQLVFTYAAENKGSLPYGWYYNRSDPVNWNDLAGDGRLTTCFALLSKLAGKHYKGDDVFIQNGQTVNAENSKENYAPFLRCPEAEQVLPHICSYVVQFVAFITPVYERPSPGLGGSYGAAPPRGIQDKPAKLKDLFNFTILIHDTAVFPGMIQDIGYVGNADVDLQRMWAGASTPQWRYYDIADRYGQLPPGLLGNNRPVRFAVDWRNIDPVPTGPEGFAGYPYQGNLRFRHNKNTSCNVGYADGRVESIKAKLNPNGSMRSHDALRKSFMIKWPAGLGIERNPNVP
jgi:prepilin-type N-terminal cleavage/methylation domain-containing protein/prepilin-type processing-associated H-X9-DG protein